MAAAVRRYFIEMTVARLVAPLHPVVAAVCMVHRLGMARCSVRGVPIRFLRYPKHCRRTKRLHHRSSRNKPCRHPHIIFRPSWP